jgi:hypothetical protein
MRPEELSGPAERGQDDSRAPSAALVGLRRSFAGSLSESWHRSRSELE